LAADSTRRNIFDKFEKFGKIDRLIMTFRNNAHGERYFPGTCFVGYKTWHEARRAVCGFNGVNAVGRRITVQFSERRTERTLDEHFVDDLYLEKKKELELRKIKRNINQWSEDQLKDLMTTISDYLRSLAAEREENQQN
jgi:RNA recognition motif. (a.k.a. RRM, RBD, or RNP domain)